MKKKLTRKLLKWVTIITTQLLIYYILFISKKIQIAIDLSKQIKLKDPQQISFIGKLEINDGATMFFIIKRSEEITFNFLKNSQSYK